MNPLARPIAAAVVMASCVVGTSVFLTTLTSPAPETPPAPAPAVPAIVSAFASHSVVAIAEPQHGIHQAGDFYVALARDPGFQRAANDIVIEFASAQSQPLLDRYVVRGDSLPPDTLRSIWRNTTKVGSWEFPTYARWLGAVRAANRLLPPGRKIRVLAGDTPIDWSRMQVPADWGRLGSNDVSLARVITDQVLAKGRKALVVLGSKHLTRGGGRDAAPNTTTRVERRYPGAMYVVYLYVGIPNDETTDARIASEVWPVPALVTLRGHWTGALAEGDRTLEGVADALLVLGPSQTLQVEKPQSVGFETRDLKELDRRSFIQWGDSTRARRFLGLPGH